MRVVFLLLAFMTLIGANENIAPTPFLMCEGSSDYCALLLMSKTSSEFIVDNSTEFDNFKRLKLEDVDFGVRLVEAQEKQRFKAIAERQQQQAMVDGLELQHLFEQGLDTLVDRNDCLTAVGVCGLTAAEAYFTGRVGIVKAMAAGIAAATMSCLQAKSQCEKFFTNVDRFKRDYKIWKLKESLAGAPGGDPSHPGDIIDIGAGEDLHPVTGHHPTGCIELPATTISTGEGDSWSSPSEIHCH